MKARSSERTNQELSSLLEIFNPSTSAPMLGKHTANFAASLASDAVIPANLPTIAELRESVAKSLNGKELPYPKNMTPKSYSVEIIGGMRCYILRSKNPQSVPTLVMFYGGGFCLNTMFAHKAFMANVAATMSCNIILPDYPLAPETKAPNVIAQAEVFLKEFLTDPIVFSTSENISLMGWSSGSNLALTLSMNLQREVPNLFRKISQLILLSPWVDLSMRVSREGPYQSQQKTDTIAAGIDLLEVMANCYLPDDCKGDEPEFCPVYRTTKEMHGLPSITVVVGGSEVLLGDAVFLADKLKQAGVPVQFIALEGQTHNYMIFHQLSLDGVYVPALITHVVKGQSIDDMVGKDGLGLTVKKFNMNEHR